MRAPGATPGPSRDSPRVAGIVPHYLRARELANQTAQVLGVSVGTVKSTTSRALLKLRDSAGLRDDPRGTFPIDGVLT